MTYKQMAIAGVKLTPKQRRKMRRRVTKVGVACRENGKQLPKWARAAIASGLAA